MAKIGASIAGGGLRFVPFSPSVNYDVPLPSGGTYTADVFGKSRPAHLGIKGGRIMWGNNTGFATVQHSGLTRTGATIESTYPNGEATHWENVADGFRMAYNTGEALTAATCRCQASFYPQPLGRFVVDIQFKLGDVTSPWSLTTRDTSPTIIWQIKPNDGQPSFSLTVDTDEFDPAKFELRLARRQLLVTTTVRVGTKNGLDLSSFHRVIIEGDFQYDNTGWLRCTVDGTVIYEVRNSNTFISNTTTYHQMIFGLYMYNNTVPASAPTRAITFKNLQSMVLNQAGFLVRR